MIFQLFSLNLSDATYKQLFSIYNNFTISILLIVISKLYIK